MKTIIFEDNYIAAMSLELMVKTMGCEVLGAFDTADNCLSIIESENIDFIFMDITLKGTLTGLEAIAALREYSNLPVIFMSGNSSKGIVDEINSFGSTALIQKPFTEGDVRQTLVDMGLIETLI